MTPILTILIMAAIAAFLCGTITFVGRQRIELRRLERKLDALLAHHGVKLSSGLSQEVQRLAHDPSKKIAAIRLHREQQPGLGLAEAKADVEAFMESRKRA